MDWNKCIICQKSSQESLQCPANSKRKDVGAGYVSFARLLEEFTSFGVKVTYCEIEISDKNQQLEEVLLENKAGWHKSCRDNFNSTKLGRVKRKLREQANEEENEEGKETGGEIISSPVKARRASIGQHNILQPLNQCFFCEEHDCSNLHQALTFEVDKKVRECAALLNDGKLTAKLSSGDMIAIEARYHSKCLASLYNRARSFRQQQVAETSNDEVELSELAFAELVAYIEEVLDENEPTLLTLSDLVKFYTSRLEHSKIEGGKVNATRLKERILEAFPSLTAHSEGREVHLALKDEIGAMLTRAKKMDLDATYLARAAHIVRREILNVKNTFNGSFPPDCQPNSVPASLVTLLGMIIKGPTTNVDPCESQVCLSIAQLIVYNSVQRARSRPDSTSNTRHARARECPLPIYTALKIHGATRDRSLIDTFYNLGISISYDRLMSVSTETTNSVLERYEREGVVCPSQLRRGLFTTSAADNLDHNPSSTSSHGSFHGTAISLVQHPSDQQLGTARDPDTFDATKPTVSKKISQLPSSYSDVTPIALPARDLKAPELPQGMSIPVATRDDNSGIRDEEDWLHNTEKLIAKEQLGPREFASWAAFRAEKSSLHSTRNPAIITLLPMFVENAHSLAMIAHSMKVVKLAIQHVNPSQVPVIAFDQPLFALAKELQWSLDEYNEDRFVVMLGGLHIEMAAFKMLGKWVSGSGWAEAICDAGVATQGVAESFLSASHLTRTRRAHQVTAASLFVLLRKAYNDYSAKQKESLMSEEEWKKDMVQRYPQFAYWVTVLDLELTCLRLVRSFRESNFNMYVKSLRELLPWMFAMDHGNYARWLSVHYRDMCILSSKHPDVFNHFQQEGCFTVSKTTRRFSSIALDHAHEQVNAGVKGDGGAVGLTENPAALRRWMVAGPEISRMIQEFEGDDTDGKDKYDHHEQKKGVQQAFVKDVVNTISSFEELGNPFKEEGPHLMALHTKDIMDDSVISTVRNARKLGGEQFNTFLKERLVDRKTPVSDPLKRNNLPTLNTQKKKNVSKDKAKVGVLKEDCSLFARLYIACQVRDGDLEDFFKFENQPWPPSLSDLGKLKGGQKADLLACLPRSDQTARAQADAVILDGAVIVQMLKPGLAVTFEEFSNNVFLPYVLKHLDTATRVDLVWDVYKEDSLKKALREKRGSGQRRKVLASTKIPQDWKGFLRVDENKDELFKLLALKV